MTFWQRCAWIYFGVSVLLVLAFGVYAIWDGRKR